LATPIPFSRVPQWVLLACLALSAPWLPGQSPASTSADALLRAGAAAEQRGDHASAIDDFQKALAIQPDLAEAHARLGASLAAAGQLDAAIDEDRRALTIAPNQPGVRMNLGQAYYQKGDLARARQQFESLHLDAPNDVQPAVRLAYVYIKLGREADAVDLLAPFEPTNQQNMDLEYAYAYGLLQTGKAQDGVPLIEKVAQATHRADAYVIAGSARMQLSEMDFALTDLDAAMHINPKIPGLVTMLGQTQNALGQTTQAIISFQTALRANPRDFDANIGLGDIRLKARDYAGARPLLELALSLRPNVALARLEMAKLNDAMGKYVESVTELESLVKDEPGYFEAHWELANVYFQLERPQDAKRERMIANQILAQRHKDEPVAPSSSEN
jgi:tetratricopeptide (TPR) repeat protein